MMISVRNILAPHKKRFALRVRKRRVLLSVATMISSPFSKSVVRPKFPRLDYKKDATWKRVTAHKYMKQARSKFNLNYVLITFWILLIKELDIKELCVDHVLNPLNRTICGLSSTIISKRLGSSPDIQTSVANCTCLYNYHPTMTTWPCALSMAPSGDHRLLLRATVIGRKKFEICHENMSKKMYSRKNRYKTSNVVVKT